MMMNSSEDELGALRVTSSLSFTKRSDAGLRPSGLFNRRWSRPSFAETNMRVIKLLNNVKKMHLEKKVRMGLDSDSVLSSLPSLPRFSAYMTPEAQFCILKGYEDILHGKLSEEFPEYGGLLKRNTTPQQKIDLRTAGSPDLDESLDEESEEGSDLECPLPAQQIDLSRLGNAERKTSSSEEIKLYEPQTTFAKMKPSPALKNLRRLSNSLTIKRESLDHLHNFQRKSSISRMFGDAEEEEVVAPLEVSPLRRYSSVHSVNDLPHDRRIVMTHKLESAMCILDDIKGKGNKSVDEGLKTNQFAPLSAYNNWASDWNREFKIQKD